MEIHHVVLVEWEWVMREILVLSHVTLVMSYLEVILGPVKVMEAGVAPMLCVQEVILYMFIAH